MSDRLRLTSFDAATGKFTYTGRVALDNKRSLTFYIDGGYQRISTGGPETGDVWLQLRFDEYEADDLEQGLRRMALWLESAARACRGLPRNVMPLEWVEAPDAD